MKTFLGNTPIKSLHIKHFEMDTNDATMLPSDLQAGVTAYARGQKVTGTGKAFEFASYGSLPTNEGFYVPSDINIIHVSSVNNPVQLGITLDNMKNQDFADNLEIGSVYVNDLCYPISVKIENNILSIICDQSVTLEVFYGKDRYV